MIDFHTHILPGIDDGSRNEAESLTMLREEQRQGVQRIVATPHFYADKHTVEDFILRREASMQRLVRALKEGVKADPQFRFPPISIGAEVYFFPGMGSRRFCLNLLKEFDRVILGSDCHNMNSRVPNLQEARTLIEKKMGRQRIDLLDQTAADLLG